MGTTLENGVYLPSEGERNCYAGLKTNWEILDQKVADVTALQQAVAGALHRQIVASLPTTDIDPNTIYMVLSGTSATENVYNEFMYVNNAWELIGTSATDLTNYYTKAEVDGKLLLKANASDLTSHTGDTTIHVTTADKATWNTVTSKANDSDVVHKAINLENQTIDLNNCYSSFGLPQSGNISFYFCNTNSGIANISNLPEQSAFFLISQSIRILSGGRIYVKQTCITLNNTYVRYCKNNIWLSWINVHDDIEPSSLSLPDLSNGIDISSYIPALDSDGNTQGSYTPSVNGFIVLKGIGNACSIVQGNIGNNTSYVTDPQTSNKIVNNFLPVVKNNPVILTIRGLRSIDFIYFYPCQGNV